MSDYALNDAAAAMLYRIAHAPKEHIAAIYAQGDGYASTPPITSQNASHVKGQLSVPQNSLRALVHNHPAGAREIDRAKFTQADAQQAMRLKVPSYISAGDRVMRYDPTSGKVEEVLAQIPLDEIRKLRIAEAMK